MVITLLISVHFFSFSDRNLLPSEQLMSSVKKFIKKIPAKALGVSEPPPEWFGNAPNVVSKNWTNKNWLKSRFHFR